MSLWWPACVGPGVCAHTRRVHPASGLQATCTHLLHLVGPLLQQHSPILRLLLLFCASRERTPPPLHHFDLDLVDDIIDDLVGRVDDAAREAERGEPKQLAAELVLHLRALKLGRDVLEEGAWACLCS